MSQQADNSYRETGSRTDSTSRSLLAQLQDNETEAWQRMVLLYTPLVEYWCRLLNVPQQDLPDLTQDVFQTVARSIRTFSKTKPSDTFRGWLRTITRTRVVDWRRRSAGKPSASGGSTALNLLNDQPFDETAARASQEQDSQVIEDQLTQQLYARALTIIQSRFQEQTWQAFWRVVIDGKSPKEVATELCMQPGAVRVAKSRVLHRLRAELGELDDS